jgi:putative ABC transport system permease protein
MTRHLLRLIWNRKRQNFLLTLEIFFSFIALFGVVLLAMQFANNSRQPLGFSIDRVWNITIDRKENDDDPAVKARHRAMMRQLLLAIREMPQVEAAAASFTSPYASWSWGGSMRISGGRQIRHGVNNVTDDFPEVFQMPLVSGRWFSREDDAATWTPVLVNVRMARDIFGDVNAVGQIIPEERDPKDPPPDPTEKPQVRRVVGVFGDFRKDGEFSAPENFLFQRARLDDTADPKANLPGRFVIRLAPGTPAAFEETLVRRLMAEAPNWSFDVNAADVMRETMLRQYSLPLIAVGTVAGFLLLMVALGLTGVVWQSVTQRIREFGLRRAKGATIADIRRQVLVEMVIMTSIALVVGVALVAQLPLLPLPSELDVIPAGVFALSIAASAGAIYLLTLLCGWYPSRLATRVQPAEALHYE